MWVVRTGTNLNNTMFTHLKDINMSYTRHLLHAWRMAFILIVHGLLPNIWETKVSDEIIDHENSVDDWRKGTLWERDEKSKAD